MASEVGGKEECMKSQKLREANVVGSFSFSFFFFIYFGVFFSQMSSGHILSIYIKQSGIKRLI